MPEVLNWLKQKKSATVCILNAQQALAKSVDKMQNSKTVTQVFLPVHFKWACSKTVPRFSVINDAITNVKHVLLWK